MACIRRRHDTLRVVKTEPSHAKTPRRKERRGNVSHAEAERKTEPWLSLAALRLCVKRSLRPGPLPLRARRSSWRRTSNMRWTRVAGWAIVLVACVMPAAEKTHRAEAAVLLQYGTNVAKVAAVELNYSP